MKGNCDACGYATDLAEYRTYPHMQEPGTKRLCEVCANTMVGRALEHPRAFQDAELMKLVAWGINRVLTEIRGEPFVSEYEDPASDDEPTNPDGSV